MLAGPSTSEMLHALRDLIIQVSVACFRLSMKQSGVMQSSVLRFRPAIWIFLIFV